MRIAQVAPLYESVPPRRYGGTERVVSYLTEELVARGHDVTLFASGDSTTRARLVPGCPQGLRLSGRPVNGVALHLAMLLRVYERARDFDVIHCHTDYLGLPLARHSTRPTIVTLHGRSTWWRPIRSIAPFPRWRWCPSATRSARRSPA